MKDCENRNIIGMKIRDGFKIAMCYRFVNFRQGEVVRWLIMFYIHEVSLEKIILNNILCKLLIFSENR
jgi:hypothetical protein